MSSIVIGEFEVVTEPDSRQAAAETASQAQPAAATGITPDAVAEIKRYLAERALRIWAD